MDTGTTAERRATHPIVFLVLYLPFGLVAGFFGVALAFQLRRSGVTTAAITGMFALALAPHIFKVLWAPVVDTTFSARGWYLASAAAVALGLAAAGAAPLSPHSMGYLGLLGFLLNLATTFLGMAAESLMAHATSAEQKGQAGGWSQAGNIGGAGLGGGAGLWMATHLSPPWIAGAVVGGVTLLCAASLLALPEPSREHRAASHRESLVGVARDVWSIARSRGGFLTLLIFILPLGTGEAANLFSSIAGDWRASADLVALVSGVAGGVLASFGAIAAGFVSDWIDRKAAYILFSMLQASLALAMAVAPHTPAMFTLFALAYAASNGVAFAGFSALTLETIGKGAAATKYNLLACVSNTPILYLGLIEGQVQTRWGSAAMLASEAVLALAGLLVFAAISLATSRRAVSRR